MKFKRFFPLVCWMVCLQSIPYSLFAQNPNFSNVPGVVVAHKAKTERTYLGSPAICIMPNGDYILAHDYFGPNKASRVGNLSTTSIYISKDKGKTWKKTKDLVGQFMSSLFVYKKDVYLIGVDGNLGNVVIRKSKNGTSWTEPFNKENGLIKEGHYHTAPTPVIVHNNRVWKAIEDADGDIPTWPKRFRAMMMSAPVGANLLAAESWTFSEPLPYDKTYLNGYFYGWLEGNAVADLEGNMINFLRVHTFDKVNERAAMITVSDDGKFQKFDNKTGFIMFPGGGKKFTVKYDEVNKRYVTLSNFVPQEYRKVETLDKIRNTLAMCSSKDLRTWTVDTIVLKTSNITHEAFQYVDWEFDGDDIIAASRTSFDDGLGGASTAHNNNLVTFHRFKKIRNINTNK